MDKYDYMREIDYIKAHSHRRFRSVSVAVAAILTVGVVLFTNVSDTVYAYTQFFASLLR